MEITDETLIPYGAFYNCDWIESISVSGDSITAINASAFYNCKSITEFEIPSTVTSIGYSAFENCSLLKSIVLPDAMKTISAYLFRNCTSLENVNFPKSLTAINESAFYNCKLLNKTDLVIPDTVTTIGTNAFYGCSKITSITVPKSVTSIGEGAFYGTNPTKVVLPFIGASRGKSGEYSSVFGYIFGTSGSIRQYYSSSSGYYLDCSIPKSIKEVEITDETLIPYGAFYNCDWIEKLYINDIEGDASVVGNNAFYNCKAMTVYLNRDSGVHTYCERNGIRHCSTREVIVDKDSLVLFRNGSDSVGSKVFLLDGSLDKDPETVWYSSDTNVVTVDRITGLISAVGPGTAIVTADSEGVTSDVAVTVYFKLETIALDKTSTQIDIGEVDLLTVIYDPENTTDDKTITWSSSDDSIVSVNENGRITANKKGKAVITATASNGKKATCNVEVLVPIKIISFDEDVVTVPRSTKKKLSLTIDPDNTTDTLSWESSDTDVATVDKYGTVTAKKVGSTIITVTSSRGKTDICQVIVNSPASSVMLSKNYANLFAGKELDLTAEMSPYDVTDSITLTTSDSSVVTVVDGKVLTLAKGTATITATADSGAYDTCVIEVESDINNADIFLEYEEIEYDSEVKEPSVEVYYNNELLIDDTDYRIEYDNNTNAGQAVVTVYSLRDDSYTERYFTITPVDINKCEFKLKESMAYTGEPLDCVEEILYGSVRLIKGTDYTVSYRDNTNVGTAKVSIIGKNNFGGSTLKSFTITPKSLSEATVTFSKSSFTYNGASQKPTVTVKDGGKRLTENKDYTLTFGDTVNAGTVTVTVTGKGNYNDVVSKTYVIGKKSISDASVVLDKEVFDYSGEECRPTLTVTSGSLQLSEGNDYDVTYEDNINVGTASITINAKDNFTGTIPAEFRIIEKNIKETKISLEAENVRYDGKEKEPVVSIVNASKNLVEGEDFKVTYDNNQDVGEGIVSIEGIGNYTGSTSVTFRIKNVLGDVDGDGQVTLMDASFIQRHLSQLSLNAPFIEKAADIDGDGIGVRDATWIQRYKAEIEIPYEIDIMI